MPLSSVVQVLFRLSALNWLVSGLVQLALGPLENRSFSWIGLLVPAVLLGSGIIVWVFAPFVSRFVSRGCDQSLSLEGVSLRSLYSTAFVGIGLWFALSNFAQVFNWLHFSIAYSKISGIPSSGPGSFYHLSSAGLTFIAGIILVATARFWARKLTEGGERDAIANP